jgi:hypothetical protein
MRIRHFVPRISHTPGVDQARRLRQPTRRATTRPSTEPVRVQRRGSNSGVIMVCGQMVSLGRAHRHKPRTVWVSDATLAIELDDEETRIVRRTTTLPVRNIKAERSRPQLHAPSRAA